MAGMVIDIVVGMEVVKVAKEVAEMVDLVFALILCPIMLFQFRLVALYEICCFHFHCVMDVWFEIVVYIFSWFQSFDFFRCCIQNFI